MEKKKMEQSYQQNFKGYWREGHKSGLPALSGIYCVYECSYDKVRNTVAISKLIYIGEAGNIRDRIATHEKTEQWRKYVSFGNELCFSSTEVDSINRNRVEAALIFEHKPPVNTEYKNDFPFDRTTISTSGENAFLKPFFTVYNTEISLSSLLSRRF